MVAYPADWEIVALGSKCEITSSKRVFEYEWEETGIPFLRTRDIANFHTGSEQKDKLFISEETYKKKIAVSGEIKKGDLLVTGVGTIGLPFIIKTNEKLYFKDGNIIWIKRSKSLNTEFLYYLFLSSNIQKQIKKACGFTTVGTFTINNAKNLQIPLPPLAEQKAIAETLETFDAHIKNLSELIEKKKAIRDGALEDLMTGRTRLKGFSGGWEVKKLGEICKIFDGTHQTPQYTSRGIKFVSVENIYDLYKSEKYISHDAYISDFKIYPSKGDILMTRIGDIGTPCIVSKNEALAFYVSLALFKFIKINNEYLYHYIKSRDFQKELYDRTLHHATPKKINKGEIGNCFVKYPPLAEQQAIAETLTAFDDEIKALEAERDKIIKIRDGAMNDLLTGKIRLKF